MLYPSPMATTTLQNTTTMGGVASEGGVDMYCSFSPQGMGGRAIGEGGYSLTYGGGGPPTRESGQPSSGRGGPPSSLPGSGDAGPADASGNVNPAPPLQAGLQHPPAHGGLKGTAPVIFDGNQKNTKLFTQEFTLYRMINQNSLTICNTYTQVALALSFMRGPAINDWVL